MTGTFCCSSLPLDLAESHFLQVLLSKFCLRREGKGVHLELGIDRNTPAIWRREQKAQLQQPTANFAGRKRTYQRALEDVLLNLGGAEYAHDAPDFPFRYANGGTLPIVRIGPDDYYCLFYRDLEPVGWNIANGGSDSRHEFLNPMEIVERELREELMMIDPEHRRWYVFCWDVENLLDRPEFGVARRLWRNAFPDLDILAFADERVPLKWLDGPDVLTVQVGDEPARTISSCFLTINALDMSIEVDKVAKIHLDEDAILLDGELNGSRLVGAPIGLFEVSGLNRRLEAEGREFLPDFVFFEGKRYPGARTAEIVSTWFAENLATRGLRQRMHLNKLVKRTDKFDLCPVTRQLIRRHLLHHGVTSEAAKPVDIFISFAGEDRSLARTVYDHLARGPGARVFFSDEGVHDAVYTRAIDEALDSARHLVAVATDPRHLTKPFVEFEWRSFFLDILNQRPGDPARQIIPFVAGFHPWDLPRPLKYFEPVRYDPKYPEQGLRRLADRISAG